MANFSEPRNRRCRHVIEVFNTSYTPANATTANVSASWNSARYSGWCLVSDDSVCIGEGRWTYSLDEKSSGDVLIHDNDRWLFGLELVKLHTAGIMLGSGEALDRALNRASRIVVCFDDRGISGASSHVTVTVTGTSDGSTVTDTLHLYGFGSKATTHTFTSVSSFSVSGGGNETLSVWADLGTGGGYREFRWWVDTNADNKYGLMAAGYMTLGQGVYTQFGREFKLRLSGYRDRLETTEFIAGYRATVRCMHYSKSGTYGSCSVAGLLGAEAVRCWRQPGLCWVGDLNTTHPTGVAVDAAHRCGSYQAATVNIEYLPYSGWTFFEDYCASTEASKEPFPESVHNAMLAAWNMINSVQQSYVNSGSWGVVDTDFTTEMNAQHLYECNIKGTVWQYLASLQEYAQVVLTNAEVYVWIDLLKRMRITELDVASVGYGSSLTLQDAAILDEPEWEVSGVTNSIMAWVQPPNEPSFYASKDASSVAGYETSMSLFMANVEEIENENIKSYDEFNTFAANYIKTHAFPSVTQKIKVDSFIPDEHYWTVNYDPLLAYTDSTNKYIDVLSTKITCKDYSLSTPVSKTFIITGIEQRWGQNGDLNIDTTIIMKRRMAASEFT